MADKQQYDPSISALLDQCATDWGDPGKNRQGLLPWGLLPLDVATWGMDIINGELNIIQGKHKSRKTTLVVNVIAHYMTSEKPKVKPFTVIDTLESGMNPKRYRDTLISVVASKYLISKGHKPTVGLQLDEKELEDAQTVMGVVNGRGGLTQSGACPVCGGPCKELRLSPEYFRYHLVTAQQREAITHAMDAMRSWPLYIYGSHPDQGDTRNLKSSLQGQKSRWVKLIEENNAKVFVSDHLQQYMWSDDPTDYEKQVRSIGHHATMVAQYGIVDLLISQTSLTSARDAASGNGKLMAAGGAKAAQEANNVITVDYYPSDSAVKVSLDESRKSGNVRVYTKVEDQSGAFYGPAVTNREQLNTIN